MIHLRVVTPAGLAAQALEGLRCSRAVVNLVHQPGVVERPAGDLITCDVAREDASVVVADLRALGVDRDGSIALHHVDAVLGATADAAVVAAKGSPADAVIWEQVAGQTSESAELSGAFLLFMVLAGLIAAVGLVLDSPILVVGAMVVGPEFGPVAGVCVALVQRRPALAWRSLRALLVGFPLAVAAVVGATLVLRATGTLPEDFDAKDSALASTITHPDLLAFLVAFGAGIAGIVSLATAKSGALIGVLISVTTIPAAAQAGLAAAYGQGDDLRGALQQLGLNLLGLALAGTLTLLVQRGLYARRSADHRVDADEVRAGAGAA